MEQQFLRWNQNGGNMLSKFLAVRIATRCVVGCREAAGPWAAVPRAARHCRSCREATARGLFSIKFILI